MSREQRCSLEFALGVKVKIEKKRRVSFLFDGIFNNQPLPLGARTSLLETSDLYDVEEKGPKRIRDLGIYVLQTASKFSVAVAVGTREWRVVAYTVDALLGYDGFRTVVVFPAADVLGAMWTQLVVRGGDVAWTAPLGAWVHDTTARRLILKRNLFFYCGFCFADEKVQNFI